MRMKDKVAVIIGAGQSPGEGMGNGRATAIVFAREGVFGFADPSALPPQAQFAVRMARLIERRGAATSGRLSRALGRRNPNSTSVSFRVLSPSYIPWICGTVTCDSSITQSQSSGK